MATILDIARLSGVSKSTVSRVINNHPHVSEDSRKRVMEAIEKLSFVRNARGVHLRTQSTKTIGVTIPVLDHPYFSPLVGMIAEKIRKSGYKIVIFQTFYSIDEEYEIFERLTENELDAVIITHTLLGEKEIKQKSRDKIVLICNEPLQTKHLDVFALDEIDAVYSSTKYLLKEGRNQLLFCADEERTPLQRQRWEGFKQAHLDFNKACTIHQKISGYSTIEDGILLGDEIFSGHCKHDGILAGSDFLAAGLLSSSKKHGVSIPKECSIIGFDDHPICLTTFPALSSIQNQTKLMVIDLVTCLLDRLSGKEFLPARKVYKGELVIRGT
ncbi:LacI family transcriptional regulator [Cytobacillus spongiae]|uniref:LacI family DNA-binding transcriptional regulator n=1 Tax=Cytobacillus spongiae TaxID=2901381 RepID=UPI001F315DB0|nr:LacI family DNA-binding transcriptional regulator [Cytobacillus spongiae]UII55587.1 LacI family transcriptional regulator [Cytobacillus spongiae]